jgi:hypothetical protein
MHSHQEMDMVESLLLIDGTDIDTERLRSLSLANAKQLLLGRLGTGSVLHVAASSSDDLRKATDDFSRVAGVSGVTTLAIRQG